MTKLRSRTHYEYDDVVDGADGGRGTYNIGVGDAGTDGGDDGADDGAGEV